LKYEVLLGIQMIGALRSKIKPFTRTIAKPIAATGINPLILNVFALILAIVAAYLIIQREFALAAILTFFAVSIDLFDGSVAELQGKKGLFSNYFENMIDRIIEMILFFGTAFLYPIASIFALGFSLLVSYAKPRVGLVIITDNRDWPSIGEHAERNILLLIGLLLSIFSFKVFNMGILEVFLWLIALTCFVGTVQRIFYAKKLISEAKQKGNILPYLKSPRKKQNKK
jgi:phosphatidylglycerophosphate synthase